MSAIERLTANALKWSAVYQGWRAGRSLDDLAVLYGMDRDAARRIVENMERVAGIGADEKAPA